MSILVIRTFILHFIKPLTILVILFSGPIKIDFAQSSASHFFGNYECVRIGNNGSSLASLIVYPYNGNDTIFRIKDPDLNGGSWDINCYLNQDSTFIGTIWPIYGRFYGVDSIYMHYYENNFPYGGYVYEYYGRNLNVAIDDNPIIPCPIHFTYNPAYHTIQIGNNVKTYEIQWELLSMAGINIISESVYSVPGETTTMYLPPLPAGVYIVRLSGGGYVKAGKIIII